jgi:hypothetical protein
MFNRLCIFLLVASPTAVLAQEQLIPIVNAVSENVAGTTITIAGTGFGTRTPTVNLAGKNLTVVGYSDTVVTANLPAEIAPGAYLLTVQNNLTRLVTLFTAAIGQIGPQGAPGLPGAQGPAGPAGTPGLPGSPGPAGAVGPAGPAGPAGSTGSVGPAGPIGPSGPAGPAGQTGATGLTGPAGPIGPSGLPGPAGPAGPIGATGLAGPSGAAGPAGPIGATGLTGATGSTGPAGPVGPAGASGLTGPAGPAGPEGPSGLAGPAGPTGPIGPQGATGPAGSLSTSGSIFTATWINPGGGSAGTPYYLAPNASLSLQSGDNTAIASATQANFAVAPAACTVVALNLGVNNFTAPQASDISTVTVYKNSVATSMTCNVTTDGNGASCSDTTDTFSVQGGDTLSLDFHETNVNPFNKLTTTLICQ